MQKLIFSLLMFFVTIGVNAQVSNNIGKKPIKSELSFDKNKFELNILHKAGDYQIKYAKQHNISLGLLVTTVGFTVTAGNIDSKDSRKACYGVGIAFGLCTLASEIYAINLQLKSGKCLKAGPMKVSYTF